MKRTFFLLFTTLFISLTATAAVADDDNNTIEVTGYHTLRVKPDMITIEFVIDENATKGRVKIEEVEKKALQALTDIGIDTKKEVKLLSSESNLLKKKKLLSTKHYSIIAHDSESVALIFAALDEVGITSMSITKTTHSQLKELQSQARKAAMDDAKKKAQELAEAVGQQAGPALYIRDNSGYEYGTYTPRLYMKAANSDMAVEEEAGGAVLPIESEDIEIRYNVFVKFKLLQ